ncbi:hypothetical protein C4N9_07990 [Pararhodobacter marinus]|uniref:Uncharacterized protein n=1 Tax=Pararhodobacter marinus TaxID=2184063 RepID=A0A2U2CCQ6_9RHOB|nr:hypothetical protein [Pararhodobacter marinus]PWE29673.1 hypothetical protein C4N9_07990 [Pararhodobacter marinus]
MTNPIELTASSLIHSLRFEHLPAHDRDKLTLRDGAYFSWDADQGDATLRVRPKLGSLFRLDAEIARKPRWLNFNLSLGPGHVPAGSALGLVFEIEGCEGESLPVFIRALKGGELADTPIAMPLRGSGEPVQRTLIHPVAEGQPLAQPSDYLTLVIQLPRTNFSMELRNMTLFVTDPDGAKALAAAS